MSCNSTLLRLDIGFLGKYFFLDFLKASISLHQINIRTNYDNVVIHVTDTNEVGLPRERGWAGGCVHCSVILTFFVWLWIIGVLEVRLVWQVLWLQNFSWCSGLLLCFGSFGLLFCYHPLELIDLNMINIQYQIIVHLHSPLKEHKSQWSYCQLCAFIFKRDRWHSYISDSWQWDMLIGFIDINIIEIYHQRRVGRSNTDWENLLNEFTGCGVVDRGWL